MALIVTVLVVFFYIFAASCFWAGVSSPPPEIEYGFAIILFYLVASVITMILSRVFYRELQPFIDQRADRVLDRFTRPTGVLTVYAVLGGFAIFLRS